MEQKDVITGTFEPKNRNIQIQTNNEKTPENVITQVPIAKSNLVNVSKSIKDKIHFFKNNKEKTEDYKPLKQQLNGNERMGLHQK